MVILTSTVTPFLKDGENHSGSYHKIHKLDLFPPEKKKKKNMTGALARP